MPLSLWTVPTGCHEIISLEASISQISLGPAVTVRMISPVLSGPTIEIVGTAAFEPAGPSKVVVTVKLHPPAMPPSSPGPSSIAYTDHAPFGFEPLNTENGVVYGPAGAGTVKVSFNSKSVGLNVPDASVPLRVSP